MNAIEPTNNGHKSKGVPLWMVLLGFLSFALLGVGALGFTVYYLRSDTRQIQRQLDALQAQKQRDDVERQKGAEAGRLTLAHNLQEQVLREVSSATNSLMQLLADGEALRGEAAALRTNQAGRRVALHPSLVPLARRFYESSLPGLSPEAELITQLEAVRRVGLQVAGNRGTAYEPAPALSETVQKAASWSADAIGKLKEARAIMTSLVQDAQVKFTRIPLTADSPTLEAAIAQLNQGEASASLQRAEQTTSVARTNAVETRAEADAQKTRAEAERYAEEVRRKLAEEQAAKERAWQEREAKLKLEESKTKVAVQEKTDEARRVELRKKAADPTVRAKLAPFITPGYTQVGGMSVDKKPYSFAGLQTGGALAPTPTGLANLVFVASTTKDRVRPRWHMNPELFQRKPQELETAKEAQQLLNELGEVLVEMGDLRP